MIIIFFIQILAFLKVVAMTHFIYCLIKLFLMATFTLLKYPGTSYRYTLLLFEHLILFLSNIVKKFLFSEFINYY